MPSRLALVIAREIELLATRRGRLVAFDVDEIEAVGAHIAELVASARPKAGWVDARELAEELGVARDWVYANAERLGVCGWGTVRGHGCASTWTRHERRLPVVALTASHRVLERRGAGVGGLGARLCPRAYRSFKAGPAGECGPCHPSILH